MASVEPTVITTTGYLIGVTDDEIALILSALRYARSSNSSWITTKDDQADELITTLSRAIG